MCKWTLKCSCFALSEPWLPFGCFCCFVVPISLGLFTWIPANLNCFVLPCLPLLPPSIRLLKFPYLHYTFLCALYLLSFWFDKLKSWLNACKNPVYLFTIKFPWQTNQFEKWKCHSTFTVKTQFVDEILMKHTTRRFRWLWNGLNLILMVLYDLHKQQDHQQEAGWIEVSHSLRKEAAVMVLVWIPLDCQMAAEQLAHNVTFYRYVGLANKL